MLFLYPNILLYLLSLLHLSIRCLLEKIYLFHMYRYLEMTFITFLDSIYYNLA